MCEKSDAAQCRLDAAQSLRVDCETKYGFGNALRKALPLPPMTDEWVNYLQRLDRADAR